MTASVRIGTCGWVDETLTKIWYPQGVTSAEERLRYYAERFDTVEVDSTYYTLPSRQMAERWAERTPPGFTFHVKAFGLMTRHPVKLEKLPADLREAAPTDERGRVDRPPREFRAEIFARFHEALEPLRATGKLGGVLMQFPSYVVYKPRSLEYIEWASEQLRGDEMLVEFRHRSWLDDDNRGQVLAFLEERSLSYVTLDAPRTEAKNLVPTVVAATSPTAYVRLLGRNAATWNVRGRSAAERFDYLYSREELKEWVEPLRELGGKAENVYAMFNNNSRSPRSSLDGPVPGLEQAEEQDEVPQAPANAFMLRQVLDEAGVPVSEPAPAQLQLGTQPG